MFVECYGWYSNSSFCPVEIVGIRISFIIKIIIRLAKLSLV